MTPDSVTEEFWAHQLDKLANYLETEPMQYDLYLDGELIGGISAIGAAAQAWIVGYKFFYPYNGAKRQFIVERLTPEGGRVRAKLNEMPLPARYLESALSFGADLWLSNEKRGSLQSRSRS